MERRAVENVAKSKQNIGATLTLKDGGFFANIKSAQRSSEELKKTLQNTTGETSKFSDALSSIGGGVKTAVKGEAAVTAAVVGITAAVGGMALAVGQDYTSASNTLAAQTGVTGAELDGLKDTMKDIYSQNYGESFEDIASAMATVKQQAQGMSADGIESMTIDALALRDTFEFDVSESVRSAMMLMDQFGLSGNEAYNLIAQGAQSGLNKNGDLLDTINEYSVHFSQIGMDAEQMFSMLNNGAASGTFSVDKLGDAVKEFGIRVRDGTADEAFTKLGMSVNATKQAFAEGGEAGRQAFTSVTDALFSMDDKVQQNLIGTELFGTMWEDLGADGIQALTNLNGEFDRTADTMERIKDIKYDDLASAWQGLKRTLTTNILLPISEQITPAISDFVNELSHGVSGTAIKGISQQIGTGLSGAITTLTNSLPVAFSAVNSFFEGIKTPINKLISSISGVGNAIIQSIPEGAFETLGIGFINTIGTIISGVSQIITAITPIISKFVSVIVQNSGTIFSIYQTIVGVITNVANILIGSFGPAINGILSLLSPIYDVISNIVTSASGAVNSLFTLLQPLFSFISSAIQAVLPILQAVISSIGTILSTAFDNLSNIFGIFSNLFQGNWSGVWENIKSIFSNTFNMVKDIASNVFNALNELTGGKLGEIKDKFVSIFTTVKDKVVSIFTSIKDTISGLWDKIKGFFKLPSIKQTGTKSILGFDIPTFGLEWNAKGGIMTKPTIFGAVGNTLQAGGEAGPEAILPLSQFWNNLERFFYNAVAPKPAMVSGGNVNNNYFNITVNGYDGDSESIAREIAQKVKEILDNM